MTVFGLPRPWRISFARAWISGFRARDSKLSTSMEIGNDFATTRRTGIPPWRYLDHRVAGRVRGQSAHRTGEVAGVGNALEADHVGAEQALDDLAAPRQLRVDAVWRKRNVIEEPDREVGASLAQHLRNELQLIVLHPDDRTV